LLHKRAKPILPPYLLPHLRARTQTHIRGEYRFSSLVKQNKKAKNYAVFCFAGKKKLLFYIYAVIVKQKFDKRFRIYYSHPALQELEERNKWMLLRTKCVFYHYHSSYKEREGCH
jgi:hypothetical protein